MKISILAHAADRRVSVSEATWAELTKWFREHSVEAGPTEEEKKKVALWSPIVWRDYAKIVNAVTVEPILALDFDKASIEQFAWVLSVLTHYELTYFWYTTHGYTGQSEPSDVAKVRLLIKCSRRIEVHEWKDFWAKSIQWLGFGFQSAIEPGKTALDFACRGLDRAFFIPCHRPGHGRETGGSDAGRDLDVDWILSNVELDDPLASVNRAKDRSGSTPREVSATGLLEDAGLVVPFEALEDFAKRLKKSKGDRKILGHYLVQVCKGESFATAGARDSTIYRLACTLAEEFPHADPYSLAVHFESSLSIMGKDAPSIDSVREKIERKQRERVAATQTDNKELIKRIRQAFAGNRITPYSPEELKEFEASGIAEGVAGVPMDHRWILSDGSTAFFFVGGDYVPAKSTSITTAARTYLAPAISAGVRTEVIERGLLVDKPPETLLKEYGQILRGVEYDLTANRATFDQDRSVITLTTAQPRPISAHYHEDVAIWLQELAGEQIDYLLDWLAVVRKLAQPAPALLLYGKSGAGKNLLAYGLARLWSERGPTDLESVAGTAFNDAILSNPLVFGDERVPQTTRGTADTESLRKIITADSFPLRKKFMNEARIVGALRIVIGVQSLDKVFQDHEMSTNDIQAIGDRFVVINVGEGARSLLRSAGGRLTTEAWVNGDQIAEHVLWLESTRTVRAGERLLVPGNAGELVSYLQVDTGIRWAVCLWIYEFLKDPARHLARAGHSPAAVLLPIDRAAAVLGENSGQNWSAPRHGPETNFEIGVNAARLVHCWNHYMPETARTPPIEKVSKTIQSLGGGRNYAGKSFRLLSPRMLADWCISQGEPIEPLLDRLRDGTPVGPSATVLGLPARNAAN